MSVRMRVNRSATGNRRSGHGLTEPRLSTCSHCGGTHLRHHMCPQCGQYRGRVVIDVVAIAEKKAAKRKARERDMGEERRTSPKASSSEEGGAGQVETEKDSRPPTPEELSR